MAILALVIFLIMPLSLDIFRLNLMGKYLTYAFVALGLVLCWGYGGILSLGQGVFFGLGGYCMAMYLKLEASTPENTAIQSTPGIPDFIQASAFTLAKLLNSFVSTSFGAWLQVGGRGKASSMRRGRCAHCMRQRVRRYHLSNSASIFLVA